METLLGASEKETGTIPAVIRTSSFTMFAVSLCCGNENLLMPEIATRSRIDLNGDRIFI